MAPRLPTSLIRNLEERRCVLFVGAGLSAQAGLPAWRELLAGAVQEVRDETLEDDAGELDRLLERGKYLELADHCRDRLGARYTEMLAERLRAADGDVPEAHRLVMRLPFTAWITTNYDKLLERAYAEVHGGWPKTLTHRDADSLGMVLFDGVPFILKAHGDIDRPDSIILTTSDYREMIHANAAFSAVFSSILMTHAVLFIGYSLNDPDFRLLLDRQLTAFGTFVPDRYAIMADIGEIERNVLWRTARIRVMTYHGDHAQLLDYLNALEQALKAERAEPQAPSRTTRGGVVPGGPKPMPAGEPVLVAAPAAAVSDEGPCLFLQRDGRSMVSRLVDASGGPVAQGAGPPVDAAWLARLTGSLHAQDGSARVGPIGAGLASLLPDDVLVALAGLAADDTMPILRLETDADLGPLPWELLAIDGGTLGTALPIVRVPTAIPERVRGVPGMPEKPHALLIGDPATGVVYDLPGARLEVERIAERLAPYGVSCTALYGPDATLKRLLRELQTGSYDVLHFAGHAWYDAVDVYLMLADGVRVTAAELRPLLGRRPPALVFLDSHYTSYLPPGTEALPPASDQEEAVHARVGGRTGFTDDLMRSGVGAFVGCCGSPTDMGAAEFAVRVYDALLDGATIAHAVRDARRETAAQLPDDATPLLFTLSGFGSLRLTGNRT